MAHEVFSAQAWLYSALTGDAELAAVVEERVYHAQAPEGATFPLVIFTMMSEADVQGVGTARILANPLFQVKVVTKGAPDADARTVADRIDEVVGKAVRQVQGSHTISARREGAISYVEQQPQSGAVFHHNGGLYRLYISD
jgi:hypothetical protein